MRPTSRPASFPHLLLAALCALGALGCARTADAARDSTPLAARDLDYLRSRRLLVPVEGVHVADIADSFDDPRDGGRRHHAVDILAPRGTPVRAADDGRVLKLRQGGAGGIALYATDPSGRFVYYYAHLDRYRDRIAEGMRVSRGDVLGYVGSTGNAPRRAPHLHFQIMRMPEGGEYWAGLPIDPRPLLSDARDR
jgi:murein DD-endopeptidase MepM/ murein hydrolase activator NlpD